MHLPTHALPEDPSTQRAVDRRRVKRAALWTLAAAVLLALVYSAQDTFDVAAWSVTPGAWTGLLGVLTAPLLHGSADHLLSNLLALLLLGTLAGSVYPRATVRTIPLAWIGSGLAAFWLGEPGSHHLGASGVLQGLAYLVVVLGLLRRDRPSIAAAMIALTFSGGLLVTVLPHDPTVSWQSHLGGAIAGVVAALLFRHADPMGPRHRYSWEYEEEAPEEIDAG
jgi:membrane associated rhomboid family serine protease